MKLLLIAITLSALVAAHSTAAAQGTANARPYKQGSAAVQRGQALYETHCTACHAIDANKTGPMHRGVVGRRVGTAPGYEYSTELANARVVWGPKTLDAWLADPEKLIPGQRMGFQLSSRKERADIIAYLATLR